eukprot:15471273-Alexandrium_andersonii.AAC.1
MLEWRTRLQLLRWQCRAEMQGAQEASGPAAAGAGATDEWNSTLGAVRCVCSEVGLRGAELVTQAGEG